jgi:predicted nuclease of restriction endonuclease-like (RecB) superfamily
MKGFSPRNLKYMRAFASAYPEAEFVQQVAAQIPWFHNCVLLDRVTDATERVWYIHKTIEYGWSRNILTHQIESSLFHRQGKPSTNFSHTLPLPQSDLAQQILKDPYCFDFLTLGVNAHERDVEQGLLKHVREFLLELGMGFAFVGNQVHLEVDGEDYYLDLLFYHLKLRCFVVIEIKMGDFRPEYAGKMNFYLSAVDESFRHPDDTPAIGLILCKTKSRMVVEYTLRNLNRPIGVSEFRIASELPALFQENLPTIEQLEAELSKSDTE